ncbi:MAG TPA: DUF423 domain-containing protein [Myxococcota bacterium]|nr:DUF423 domain-containing protein [Myxococcota bacterium]
MGARTAAVTGALAVALGAFGAHGLKQVVTDPHLLEVWDTGARYHLLHAVVLLVLAGRPASPWAPRLLLAGITLFSGSLYLMAITGARWLGAVTPLGGLCFIAGWLAIGWTAAGDP